MRWVAALLLAAPAVRPALAQEAVDVNTVVAGLQEREAALTAYTVRWVSKYAAERHATAIDAWEAGALRGTTWLYLTCGPDTAPREEELSVAGEMAWSRYAGRTGNVRKCYDGVRFVAFYPQSSEEAPFLCTIQALPPPMTRGQVMAEALDLLLEPGDGRQWSALVADCADPTASREVFEGEPCIRVECGDVGGPDLTLWLAPERDWAVAGRESRWPNGPVGRARVVEWLRADDRLWVPGRVRTEVYEDPIGAEPLLLSGTFECTVHAFTLVSDPDDPRFHLDPESLPEGSTINDFTRR